MEGLLSKAERVSRALFGNFSYSPMPRTTALIGEDGKQLTPPKPAWGTSRKLAAAAGVGVCVSFGVICVVATVSAATTLRNEKPSSRPEFPSSGHSLRAVPQERMNRTAGSAVVAPKKRRELERCCGSETAECFSCQKKVSITDFCLRQGHGSVSGCEGYCGLNEDGVNYPGGDIGSRRTPSSQSCCAACRAHSNCTSWSWGKDDERDDYQICYLKNQLQLRQEFDGGYISGLPGQDSLTFQIRIQEDKCLDVHSIQHKWGVSTCAAAAALSQKWSYDRTTGQIRNSNLGESTCLDALRADQPGSNIFLHRCSISFPSQRWVYDSIAGQVENAFGFCMQLKSGSQTVQLQPCKPNSESQAWTFSAGSERDLPASPLEQTSTTSTSSMSTTTVSSTMTTSTFSVTSTTKTGETNIGQEGVADDSLFCFSLMLPWGYEPDLLRMQITERRSIFACEDFVVYSSVALDLGSGYTTSRIDMDLHCPLGGQYHTALNTPIFRKIWNQIIQDGRYELHQWTVKADPDCVFLPGRLRDIVRMESLRQRVDHGKGLFLNNCRFGLHGPMEVVSRLALEAYGKNAHRCQQPPQEDVYLQHCLLSIGVVQMNQFNLLAEDACRSPDWQSCHGPQAAFHPFKSLNAFRNCQAEAEKNGTWSKTKFIAVKATAETIGMDPETAKLGIGLLADEPADEMTAAKK